MKLILIALGTLLMLAAPAAAEEDNCPWFEKHKCAKHLKTVPTDDFILVCGYVNGPAKVTFHFNRPDGTYYREPIARTYNGDWQKGFGRTWFEQVHRDGGTLKICAGEKGEFGVVFEKEDIIKHLKHGRICPERIRLTGGVYPKKQKDEPNSQSEVPKNSPPEAPQKEPLEVNLLNPPRP